MEHIKFPSIEQFRSVVKEVEHIARFKGKTDSGEAIFDRNAPLPQINFVGTVKLHGTNAGIQYNASEDAVAFQSRERMLTLDSDNAGFALWATQYQDKVAEVLREYSDQMGAHGAVIFGEWCGGNIQKNVAICELPKMFVVFGIMAYYDVQEDGVRRSVWEDLTKSPEIMKKVKEAIPCSAIVDYPSYEVMVDFENPHLTQQEIFDLVLAVEDCCPVGKTHGVEGIGEGIVFSAFHQGRRLVFKAKGEKHTGGKSKVTKVAAVNVEKIENIKALAAEVAHVGRLEQGFAYLQEMQIERTPKAVGDYIRWVMNDIIKEESALFVESQIEFKDASKEISNIARKYFFEKM